MINAQHVITQLLEDDENDLDWTPDPADVDTPADIKAAAHDATSADWRWQAIHELRGAEDPDIEMPDLSDDPDSEDTLKVEIMGIEYMLYKDDDVAEAAAVEQVKDDLKMYPSVFNQEWLSNFINTKRLNDTLWSDYEDNSLRERCSSAEEWRDYLIEENILDKEDFYSEEGDELPIDRHLDDKIDEAIDTWVERQKDEFDGLDYLRDIYGDETIARAIEIAGIDYDEAAKSAVNSDGWPHFLSRYDGHYETLPSGAVYYRNE